MTAEQIKELLVLIVGGGGGSLALVKLWMDYRKSKRGEDRIDSQIIFDRMEKLNERCRKDHEECLNDSAELRAEIRAGLKRLELPATSATAVVVADEDGNIVEWNAPATLLFEREAKDVLGQPVVTLVPPRYRGAHLPAIQSAIKGRKKIDYNVLHKLDALLPDGSERPISVRLSSSENGGYRVAAEITRR